MKKQKFCVYHHTLSIEDKKLIGRNFIVLKDEEGFLQFTDFHKYVRSPRKTVRDIAYDGNNRFDFVVKLLNYAFFEREIDSLDRTVCISQ